MPFWRHSPNAGGVAEPLAIHLQCTGKRAQAFAKSMGWMTTARLAGLLHDLGKYADQFQRRLEDASVPAKDHWSAGAAVALQLYGKAGFAAALAIQGYHMGLPDIAPTWREHHRDLNELVRDHGDQLSDADLRCLLTRWHDDGFTLEAQPPADAPRVTPGAVSMLDVRMLFSALVDADFLETEAHFNGTAQTPRNYRPEGPALDMEVALQRVSERVAHLSAGQRGSEVVQQARYALWSAALEAAERPTGLFTMTAPTGTGKTLAMLGFALAHARRHGLRRVVLVMPFLNIIEQAARQYRDLFTGSGFPEATVLEDHSLAELDPGEDAGDTAVDGAHGSGSYGVCWRRTGTARSC